MLRIFSLFSLLFVPMLLSAQSQPAISGGQSALWAGGELSVFSDDWACGSLACSHLLIGPAAFFDLNLPRRIGVEGEARWTNWHGADGSKQSNYLLGPRYRLFRNGRLDGWGKVLLGGGWITSPGYPNAVGSLKGSYFDIAPGITANYRLSDRWALRADYEYQIWPSFAAPPGYNSSGQLIQHDHGLNPNGLSFGFSYRVIGR